MARLKPLLICLIFIALAQYAPLSAAEVVKLFPINAEMSSTPYGGSQYHWRAAKCIDGIRTGDPSQYNSSMCHSTCEKNAPWLALEFSGQVNVTRVDIYNRDDSFAARLKNVEVRLTEELQPLDQMYTGGELLGTFTGPGTTDQTIIKVEGKAPKIGRYVLIQMRNRDCLNLYEVEAFGQEIRLAPPNASVMSKVSSVVLVVALLVNAILF